jgi:hypothetical protein
LCASLAIAQRAKPADAQVNDVVVGVTISCPYENAIKGSCWSGAYWALMQLDGVKSVDESANGYNCTARVYLKHDGLPDPDKWAAQFKKSVDQTYVFRGVEVSVQGTVEGDDGSLILRVPGVEQPIKLGQLEHKLQWNSKKKAARQPEPDEKDAYQQLTAKKSEAKANEFGVEVTGPLRAVDKKLVLEVREFFAATPEARSQQQD